MYLPLCPILFFRVASPCGCEQLVTRAIAHPLAVGLVEEGASDRGRQRSPRLNPKTTPRSRGGLRLRGSVAGSVAFAVYCSTRPTYGEPLDSASFRPEFLATCAHMGQI